MAVFSALIRDTSLHTLRSVTCMGSVMSKKGCIRLMTDQNVRNAFKIIQNIQTEMTAKATYGMKALKLSTQFDLSP